MPLLPYVSNWIQSSKMNSENSSSIARSRQNENEFWSRSSTKQGAKCPFFWKNGQNFCRGHFLSTKNCSNNVWIISDTILVFGITWSVLESKKKYVESKNSGQIFPSNWQNDNWKVYFSSYCNVAHENARKRKRSSKKTAQVGPKPQPQLLECNIAKNWNLARKYRVSMKNQYFFAILFLFDGYDRWDDLWKNDRVAWWDFVSIKRTISKYYAFLRA